MNKSEKVTEDIFSLFEKYGDNDYDGEPVSQTSHMIQCGMRAMDMGEDEELILGAFLHDIGHLLRHEQETEAMGNFGVVNHEGVGAEYLRAKGFSERVCAMVEKACRCKTLPRCNRPFLPWQIIRSQPANTDLAGWADDRGRCSGIETTSLFRRYH